MLTHAHLDHCGLLPLLVKAGYRGPIHATAGTVELATLVLLDSGHLHEEFAKREARWEKRNPDKAVADDRAERDVYQAAVDLAESSSEAVAVETAQAPTGQHVETTIEPEPPAAWPRDPEADLRAQPPALDIDLDAPLYTVKDAERALGHFRPIDYEEEREVAPGVWATFLDAGHILGSAIIRLRVQDAEGARSGSSSVPATSVGPGRRSCAIRPRYSAADYILVESTYGGREHEPQDEAIRILAETVRLVADAGGVLLVPSFAIGRTQEVVWELDRLIERGEIPQLPLYLDSPMASKASDIYRRHPEYYDEQTAQLLRDGDDPARLPGPGR